MRVITNKINVAMIYKIYTHKPYTQTIVRDVDIHSHGAL